jgi:hypothetical protein
MKKLLAIALALNVSFSVVVPLDSPSVEARSSHSCGGSYYRNSRGRCVHRPMRSHRPPAGASARCRDGTYSFSQSRRGTCSWHGGVATWLD